MRARKSSDHVDASINESLDAEFRQDVAELPPQARHEKDGKVVIGELSTKTNAHEISGPKPEALHEMPDK